MIRSPLASFHARACDLWIHENYLSLRRVGNHGHEDYQQLYQRISLSVEAPITQAFVSGDTIIVPLSQVVHQYPSLSIDGPFWSELQQENGDGDLIHTPIIFEGAPIGVYTFLSDRFNDWGQENLLRLDSIAAALALWMSHPRSRLLDLAPPLSAIGLTLTPRQVEILELVREGKSNEAISAHLGFSQSTIKQELLRITKRLRVNNRHDAVEQATQLNLLHPSGPQ